MFAAGIRPRDDLARAAGLDDGGAGRRRRRRHAAPRPTPTSGPSASVAAHRGGRPYGLVAPGYQHGRGRGRPARRAATPPSPGADTVHQAQAAGRRRRQRRRLLRRHAGGRGGDLRAIRWPASTRSWSCRPTAPGCWAGSWSATPPPTGPSLQYVANGLPAPERPERLILPGRRRRARRAAAPPTCPRPPPCARASTSPRARSAGRSRAASSTTWARRQGLHQGRHRLRRAASPCSTSCSTTSCAGRAGEVSQPAVRALRPVRAPGAVRHRAGAPASASFAELIGRLRHRRAAARSASRRWRRCWPRSAPATSSTASRPALQDTNDHFLANLQRDGTYSVVPRVPGGEITPDQLIALGEVAQDFDLYTKITGGQRIDLFGARVDQLPAIWERLIDAGLRVGSRLRQGAAHREVVRGRHLVPLRRAGLGGHGHRPRAALPRPARAPQDQDGRVGLRPGVRRGPGQGRRRHRHRAGLEPLRRRQRRHAAPARGAAGRRPRRRDADPVPSTGSSCSTSAPPTGSSAPPRGSTSWRAASTTCGGSSRRRPRHLRRPRRRHGPPRRDLRVRVAGDARPTPSGWPGSGRSSTPTSPTGRPPTVRVRGSASRSSSAPPAWPAPGRSDR